MRLRRWGLALAGLAMTAGMLPAVAAGAPAGTNGWMVTHPAPGITVYAGTLGAASPAQHWTVTVRFPAGGGGGSDPDAPTADLADRAAADALAARLRAAGAMPEVQRVDWPAFTDTPRGPLGWRVRVGSYPDKQAATAAAEGLTDRGFAAAADWTGQDGDSAAAPGGVQRVHVAVLDPRRVRLTASYGRALAGRETTSATARADGAAVAVNGGFFVIDPQDGIPGEPAGIGVRHGVLQSEATNGRVALVLGDGGRHPAIRELRSTLRVSVAGRAGREVDGVNRVPGTIRNCGGTGGDTPTQRPRHDTTCTDPGELVLLTRQLGGPAPTGPGVQAVLDAHDRVVALRPRGGQHQARVLQGVGDGADWLRAHARPGTRLHLAGRVNDGHRTVHFGEDDDVINGGPWLLRGGRVAVNANADGVVHPGDPSFVYNWAMRNNPRTMVGLDRAGRVLLVTVDGRQPGVSEGLSVLAGARLMRSFGAVDAINLDGGGSTAMAVHGRLVTVPSDATGERPVGDVLEAFAG